MRRHAHKHYSQAGQSRKRKLESLPAPPELKIYDFIKNLNTTRLPQPNKRWVPPVQSLRQHQERSIALAQDAEAVLAGRCPPPSCVTGSLHLASPELRLAMPAQVFYYKNMRLYVRDPYWKKLLERFEFGLRIPEIFFQNSNFFNSRGLQLHEIK